MNATITMVRAQFQISLTPPETLELGRFCVIWGQIDHFLFACVTKLVAADLRAGITILGGMTTGPLVNLLNKNRKRITNKETRQIAKEFCDEMGGLLTIRNHLLHGIWGWYLPGKSVSKGKPGCLYLKDPDHPIYPPQITDAANKAARLTFKIYRVYLDIYGAPPQSPDVRPKYLFGPGELSMPKGTQLTRLE